MAQLGSLDEELFEGSKMNIFYFVFHSVLTAFYQFDWNLSFIFCLSEWVTLVMRVD